MNAVILLIIGIIGLWFGSGLVVESAKKLSVIFGISLGLIGLTIISIGTSLPEIFTNILSAVKTSHGIEASGIAIGTNIGSCLTQITLILGITAIIGTMRVDKKMLSRDGTMVLVAIVAMFIAGFNGIVSQIEGIVLIIGYLIYLFVISNDEKVLSKIQGEIKSAKSNNTSKAFGKSVLWNFLIMASGIAVLLYASDLVVESALELSVMLGVSQSFVGVMIIGVGTGLPELSTAIRGIMKNADQVSLGTLIGSNVTDPMFSLGSGAAVANLGFDKSLLWFDIPYWFFASILALYLMKKKMIFKKKDKKEGIILIAVYVLFVIIKISFFR